MAKTRKMARPSIIMTEADAEALSGLAATVETRLPDLADMLTDEIDRAKIVKDDKLPADIVRMNSTVTFVNESIGADQGSGRERTVTLVYPAEADIESGRISILTPIGAGLIGLKTGQSIQWPDRDGKDHVLRIIKVA